MSYEPTIIVSKSDLDKHKDYILNGDWQYSGALEYKKDQKTGKGEDGRTVMEYLNHAYQNYKICEVRKVKFILLSPCFTSFNGFVRKKLDDMGVEYDLDN